MLTNIQKYNRMKTKTIKAKFIDGMFKPMENFKLPEGKEVTIKILKESSPNIDNWEALANSDFSKNWDNKQDAIYDDWKKIYNIQ